MAIDIHHLPGFVDLQVNGFLGVDYSADDLTLDKVLMTAREINKRGTAGFLATVITSSEKTYEKNLGLIAQAMKDPEVGHVILGIHAEGPFLSDKPGAVGAHNPAYVKKPSVEFFQKMLDWSRNTIKVLTIAAENEGAPELIRYAVSKGVVVSLGHHLASYEDVKNIFRDNMYTRIPVYEETPEKIVGIINIKDFLFVEDPDFFDVRKIMREVYFTYEYKKTQDLLNEMREKSAPMTIVLNEYGAAEGLVTLEDLLEEIVGDIKDEYDEDERDTIKETGEREYLIEGSMKLDDINDRLGTNLESENYDSIGGMIIDHLDDRLPEQEEEVTLEDGTILKVEEFTDNRIVNVKMVLPEPKEEDEAAEAGDEGKEKSKETGE